MESDGGDSESTLKESDLEEEGYGGEMEIAIRKSPKKSKKIGMVERKFRVNLERK